MPNIDKYRAFLAFKWTVYSLLVVDMVLFYFMNGVTAVVDQVGWLLLIGIFEYETTSLDEEYSGRLQKYAIWAARLCAYALILDSAISYYESGNWLDLINEVAWLLVCAVLEYDVYVPGEYGTTEWRVRNGVKALLYAVLVGCAIMWGFTGDLLDTYDAALWILCFGVVELNIFRFEVEEEVQEGAVPEMAPQGRPDLTADG